MHTIKLYDSEPYSKNFTAKITGIEKTGGGLLLELDRTLFFPEEGGQSSDTGLINGFKVTHVSITGDRILHSIEGDVSSGLCEGGEVCGEINWARRFSNMQNHSGEHILSGILHRDFSSENIGFHLSDNIVTLDTSKALSEEELDRAEARANEAVYANIPISYRYYKPSELCSLEYRSKKEISGDVRIVSIEGIDSCACCAPHVKNTGEIGIIKIISSINYKGGKRLTILSGKRAYEYLSRQQKITDHLSRLLSAPMDSLSDATEKLLDQARVLKSEIAEASGKRLFDQAAALPESLRNAIIFTDDANVNNITMRKAVNLLSERHKGICAVFAKSGESYRFILSFPDGDALLISAALKESLGAKCGGSKEMIQGNVIAQEDGLNDLLGGF